jgi:hypothetical protein
MLLLNLGLPRKPLLLLKRLPPLAKRDEKL